MVRKEKRGNNIKCSIKATKGRKVWRMKTETKNKGNKQKTVTNTRDVNQIISIITLNVSGLQSTGYITDIYKTATSNSR